MKTIRIKSFEDAVISAVLNNSGVEVSLPKEGNGKFDSICGISRSWEGWGNVIRVRDAADYFNFFSDEAYYIPFYCVEAQAEK